MSVVPVVVVSPFACSPVVFCGSVDSVFSVPARLFAFSACGLFSEVVPASFPVCVLF